ncbi:hypothetical protein JMJ35_007552 [Cladonia borealis]|uniref:Heterokaryon incompatibility domain-containing protein n=1 Tax=Cladonia borealis TaxID=184061 RepID=A0AA39QYQ4_9LECA|nr:hypothetical protein JMJ35_007552 [Cladonia borealis]
MDLNAPGDHVRLHPKARFYFTYCPLKNPRGDIRELGLLPGRFESPIDCTLKPRSLIAATKHGLNQKYEALSYVWDHEEPTDSINIHVDGQFSGVMYITPSLCAALRRLRDRGSVRFLWIDAICINQTNFYEMNHQVPLMADVYRRAEHLYVWLGQSSADSDKALQFIGDTEYLIARSAWQQEESDWRAFYSFISRPWFRHRWSVQAIALAREVTLICDDRTVGWNELVDALSIVQRFITKSSNDKFRYKDYAEWDQVSFQPAFRLAEIRNDVRRVSGDGDATGCPWSLETLMWKFQDFETSKPRDDIYALLALAKDRSLMSPRFGIDYYSIYPKVCEKYILSMIKIYGSLDVLCRPWRPYEAVPWKPSEDGYPDNCVYTPSWLPPNCSFTFGRGDIAKYERINADALVGPPEAGKRYYNACGSVGVTDACRFDWDKLGSLFVEGLVVDAIAEKQPAAFGGKERRILDDGVLDQWRAAVGWMDLAKEPPDAYWRTLVANRGPNGSDTPDFYPIACQEQAKDRDYRVAENYKCDPDLDTTAKPRATDAHVAEFVQRVQEVVLNRQLIKTVDGRLGLAPHLAKKRDLVCILFGCSVPIVLRPMQDPETHERFFEIIGECYIHGIMEGEALELAKSGDDSISQEEFEIR